MSWCHSCPPWTARQWTHRWLSLTVSKDWLDGGLRGQFRERHMCMTKYLDFVHSPFEPVHLNNFSLISSYTKASRPHGLLPAKQKVGESCGLQGAVAYGAAAGEIPLHIHHRIGPAPPPAVAASVWWGGTWPALESKRPWREAESPSVMVLLAGNARCFPRKFPLPTNKHFLPFPFQLKIKVFF